MPTERQGQQAQGESLVPGAKGKTSGGRKLLNGLWEEGQLAREDMLGLRKKSINFVKVLSIGRKQVHTLNMVPMSPPSG